MPSLQMKSTMHKLNVAMSGKLLICQGKHFLKEICIKTVRRVYSPNKGIRQTHKGSTYLHVLNLYNAISPERFPLILQDWNLVQYKCTFQFVLSKCTILKIKYNKIIQ